MNLDDKLREICDANWGAERYHGDSNDEEAIAQIKQAFAEAGYIDGHDYLHFLTERHKPSEALQAYMDKVEAANITGDNT